MDMIEAVIKPQKLDEVAPSLAPVLALPLGANDSGRTTRPLARSHPLRTPATPRLIQQRVANLPDRLISQSENFPPHRAVRLTARAVQVHTSFVIRLLFRYSKMSA